MGSEFWVLRKSDCSNRMVTLTMITLSDFHCPPEKCCRKVFYKLETLHEIGDFLLQFNHKIDANINKNTINRRTFTCRVKFASTFPAGFDATHLYCPLSSVLTLVRTRVLWPSKDPFSKMRNLWRPRLDRELLSTSFPSRYQRTLDLGTEPTLQMMVAFSPEIKT